MPNAKFTDTTEKGLETLIFDHMTGLTGLTSLEVTAIHESPDMGYGGSGWYAGTPESYDRAYAIDLLQLSKFLKSTQPEIFEAVDFDNDSPTRRSFLARLQGEITKRGTIDVLRKGIKHGAHHIDLYCGLPSKDNERAVEQFEKNRFSLTRQLRYSLDETQRSLDLAVFINGLPVFTFELKNNLTKQTYQDAIEQYKRDRDPRELLFQFGRCVAHFALDDQQIHYCTHLKGKASWFLPFNKGFDDGAGNPPNPEGIKTDYLWRVTLIPANLAHILENYAQIVESTDPRTGKKKVVQIFPRYHQLDVVQKLLDDVRGRGSGKRYLIQHSAGSGKSNSIAWLAHQLIDIKHNDDLVFDSIIVVTDRRLLDKQIKDTIKQFAQVGATVGHAERSGDLKKFIEDGKKIIISTVQKFPFILEEIGSDHRSRKFAIIIDEAHSSQGSKLSTAMNRALGEEADYEDAINYLMESRKMLSNASYFAFTATPKNKTLEIFGETQVEDGVNKPKPFHSYTMKQAIQEGFILDVLSSYTTITSHYKLIKTIEADPEFDTKKAQKKLRKFVEGNDHAIRIKAEIMVDHFHDQVHGLNKIGGQARAMVVTGGIERALQYYQAISDYLVERKSPYRAIVAFSGEFDFGGKKVKESDMNGFPSADIADRIKEDPYRFLICADKFQTGYDEPLLHTMYVDKVLSGVKAVQTLSRLNRAYPQKSDTFVLDFANTTDTIQTAFEPYYRTTILSSTTDPNKLHDLKADLDNIQVYSQDQIDALVENFLTGADRDTLDPYLDSSVANYIQLDEDGQVDFKAKAKTFVRTYAFLASIITYTNADWEKLSIFLNFLIPKLPAPIDVDLAKGILETIDIDSYRAEKQATRKIQLQDEDGLIEPVPTEAGGFKPEPELDQLSNILKNFNDLFGNINWTDSDRVHRLITQDIPDSISQDVAYQNARKNSDKQNARIELNKALQRVMTDVLNDDTELFKQFSGNDSFKSWLENMMFDVTYNPKENKGSK
jgi:type I restriction enzyme R subunit